MTGSIYGYTSVYRFKLADYNIQGWHAYEYENWRSVDALLNSFVTLLNYTGMWGNSVTYAVNDLAADPADSLIYKCNTQHTSAAAGSFSSDRVANPSYWTAVDQTAFDASSNRIMKRLRHMQQEAGAINANANRAYLMAIQSVSAAATSANNAAKSATNAEAARNSSLFILDQTKKAQRLINIFNPANIAFYAEVFN